MSLKTEKLSFETQKKRSDDLNLQNEDFRSKIETFQSQKKLIDSEKSKLEFTTKTLCQEKEILEESLRNSKAKLVEVTMHFDTQKAQTIEQQKLREKLGKDCNELIESEKILKKKFDKLKQKNLELVGKMSELVNEKSELTEGNSGLVGKVNHAKGELLESRNNENIWEMKFQAEKK
jgi:predicted nuclease with TOPRIM domain